MQQATLPRRLPVIVFCLQAAACGGGQAHTNANASGGGADAGSGSAGETAVTSPPAGEPGSSPTSNGNGSSNTSASSDASVPSHPSPSSDASASNASGDAAAPYVPGGLRWVGRVDASNPSAVKFAWSATGFVGVVRGPKISVSLQTENTPTVLFQPIVDGVAGARFEVPEGSAQTVILADQLTPGDHVVELYRETEGMFGDSVFLGMVDGTVEGAPPAPGRLIEFVGDSISAGYGNLGVDVHQPPGGPTCTFSIETEAATQAYDSMVGGDLTAEVSIIARSGWGIVRDQNGNTANVLPAVYDDTVGTEASPTWSFARQPDAVVINLGTNDSAQGDPGTAYETAYLAFLRVVRGHYPSAWIFLTIGPMTPDPLLTAMRAHLTQVIASFGDSRSSTIDLAPQDKTSTGCDYHPNVAEDRVMATAITAGIRAKLGW